MRFVWVAFLCLNVFLSGCVTNTSMDGNNSISKNSSSNLQSFDKFVQIRFSDSVIFQQAFDQSSRHYSNIKAKHEMSLNAERFAKRAKFNCAEPLEIEQYTLFASDKQIVLPPAHKKYTDQYMYRYTAKICGKSHVLSILILSNSYTDYRSLEMLPGGTAVGLRLQSDVLNGPGYITVLSFHARKHGVDLRDCVASGNYAVLDTKILKEGLMSWTEEWKVSACGAQITVPIEFNDDLMGGYYYSVSAQ